MADASTSSNPSKKSRDYQNVYQFRVSLKGVKPTIWRRILVPENYNFKELHNAVNCAMGWLNSHMHEFTIKNPITGVKEKIGKKEEDDVDFFGEPLNTIDEKVTKISDYFVTPKYKAKYMYDFGDGWDHDVEFQKSLPADENTEYPKCVAGKRACPPDNCGGPWGYEEMLKVLSDPNDPEYENRRTDLAINGGVDPDEFDPDEFDPQKVDFYNTDDLLERIFCF